MTFKFQRKRIDTIPENRILDELEKAAKFFNYIEFSWRDFNNYGGMPSSHSAMVNAFPQR